MTDELYKQAILLFISVAGALGIGLGARRVLSKDSRDRAKNESEEDYFSKALDELKLDRNNWRQTAEAAWERINEKDRRIVGLEHALRNSEFARRAQRRIVITKCPEVAAYLPSEPAPFDEDPLL